MSYLKHRSFGKLLSESVLTERANLDSGLVDIAMAILDGLRDEDYDAISGVMGTRPYISVTDFDAEDVWVGAEEMRALLLDILGEDWTETTILQPYGSAEVVLTASTAPGSPYVCVDWAFEEDPVQIYIQRWEPPAEDSDHVKGIGGVASLPAADYYSRGY